jgi:hypothetical protein
MNRLTKLFLTFMGATTLAILAYPAVSKIVKADDVREGFGMEISITGRQPFTMSVRAKDERLALLPVNATGAAAVKVVPAVTGGTMKLHLLAVVDKLPELSSCDDIKKLKTERVASYVVGEGDVLRVSDFEKFGVAPFTIKVTSMAAVQTVCPDGACCCGGNTCYPNPGKCIECGGCGSCCKSGSGADEFNTVNP